MAVTVGMNWYCPKCGSYVILKECCNKSCDYKGRGVLDKPMLEKKEGGK